MKKLINFSEKQIEQIGKDAALHEISFTEMVKRILDKNYESKKEGVN